MYEDLVKRLREHGEFLIVSDRMKAPPNVNVRNVFAEDYAQAADAIEELSREIDIDNAAMTAMDEAMPRWIPVTERLPEDGQDILAVQSWDGEARIVPANYDRGLWYDCVFDYPAEHITHWMPLPESPKEET